MHLSNQSLLVIILVGIVAGYLAGRVMQGGGFAVVRSGKRVDFRAGFGGEERGVITAGVVDDCDGKSGREASANDAGDGGRFVAGGDENPGGRFHAGRVVPGLGQPEMVERRIKRPRAYRLG